ncbi:MAG TPA: hypothetical protein VJU61_12225 [Polyangiaceae bacterium]|nr:hypothetical protein [Polyangiaceae bacterium]
MSATLPRSAPALTHPLTLLALALWATNNHLLKGWGPAALTGKLSDVAALVVGPLVLFGIAEWARPRLVQQRPGRMLAACCAALGLLLLGLELSPAVELGYQHLIAGAKFAALSLAALLSGQALPHYRLVPTTPDLTDLLTLPTLGVAWWLVWRTGGLAASGAPGVPS